MAKKRKMKIEDVLLLQGISSPKISPDGQGAVYVLSSTDPETKKGAQNLWHVPVSGGSARPLTHSLEGGNTQPSWSPDGKTVAFLSNRPLTPDEKKEDRKQRLWLLPVDGGEARCLRQIETAVGAFWWAPDGKRILFLAEDPPSKAAKRLKDAGGIIVVDKFPKRSQLRIVETDGDKPRKLTRDRTHKGGAQWSPNGKQIVFERRPNAEANDSSDCGLYVVSADGQGLRKLIDDEGTNTSPAWSPDGKTIAFVRRDRRRGIWPQYLAAISSRGGPFRPLTDRLDRQAGPPVWSGNGRELYFGVQDGVCSHLYKVSLRSPRVEAVTTGNRALNGFDFSSDRRRMVFTLGDSPEGAQLRAASSDGSDERLLVASNPQLRGIRLGRLQTVRWRSTDGRPIEGLLVLPTGYRKGKRVPTLVRPHGGPHGACSLAFQADLQFLANHGYAVFLPNFRGSSGYGVEFARANVNDWGGGDYEDIMSGVDLLIDKGVADPKRLGVFGFSYGGYMTGFIIGQTRRFRAAIAGGGVHSARSFYGTTDIPAFMEYYYEGTPWEVPENYDRASPVAHLKHAATPTLIYHGETDRRVPVGQSEELYAALKRRRVPVEFVRYPRAGHGIGEYDHRRDLLERQLAWFDRYVKGKRR